MKRSILRFSLFIALILLLLTWLPPVIAPEYFNWLDLSRQAALTLLITIPLVAIIFYRNYKRRKRNYFHPSKDSAEDEITKQDAQQRKHKLNSDWQQLWSKLNQQNHGNPYALPWLMMLGTDGSGKTGWLIDAGFERINGYASNQRSGIIFWLGENAIIIELAGHYYTREKDLLAENLWQYLITLLKKKRPRRPLTGILATLSTDQLVMRQPSGLLELARQLRWRLMELNRQFGLQLPVWFLLTQADRLNGFSEFFRSCSQPKQVMPWGFFLHEGYRRDHFQQAFDLCHQELCYSLLDCIQHEKDNNTRQALMRYCLQFSLLGERLRFFCEEIFQNQQNTPSPELKGIWFSSCGQYGTSINLLASELANQHGFTVIREQPQAQDSQSYFNQQFFSRVIFNDLGGVGENPTARKFWLLRSSLSYAAMLLVLIAGLGLLWKQIKYNEHLLNRQIVVTREFKASSAHLGSKHAFIDALTPLNQLRDLDQLYQQSSHWKHHFGMLDWNTTQRVHEIYQKQLRKYLLLPLTNQLRQNLQQSVLSHGENLFDDLQYYLMMFKPDLRDIEALEAHIHYILDQQQALEYNDQKTLGLLLKDCWQIDNPDIQFSQHLIDQASNSLASQIDEKVIYDHIRSLPKYSGTLSITELFGSDFESLFTLQASERDAGFPVFFTRSQYKSLDLSATSPLIHQEISNLNRIRKGTALVSPVEMVRISSQVRQLYFQEYIRTWQSLLNRIKMREALGIVRIQRQISLLYKGEGALVYSFMNTIASETSLADPPAKQNPATTAREAGQITQSSRLQKASYLLGKADSLLSNKTISPDNPAVVNQAFLEYANYSANNRASLNAVIDILLQELQSVYVHYDHNLTLYTHAATIVQGSKNILLDLWQQADSDTTVAGQWLIELVNSFWTQTIYSAGLYCQKLWEQDVYGFWDQYINLRFPMAENATNEAQISDFAELFKPGGKLDNYTQAILAPFVIATKTGWQLKTVRGNALPLSRSFITQLNEVAKLQDSLFNADGSLQVNYRMRVKELTPQATEFSLRDSNGRFVYRHGPQLWQDRKWPGQETEQISVMLMNNNQKLSQKNYSGSWAWLRFMFQSQQWQNGSKIEVRHSDKGYSTQLELTVDRRSNPFNKQLYNKVQLPEKIIR